MNAPAFNENLLDSIAIQHGKDEVTKAIGLIIATSLSNFENPEVKHKVLLAMERYNKAAEGLARDNDTESLLDLLEQLRRYKPLLSRQALQDFENKSRMMADKLRDVSNLKHPADAEKFHQVSKEYLEKAFLYRERLATARLFYDTQCVDELYEEWNKIALKWALVLSEAFPVTEETPEHHFEYGTEQ